MRERIKLFLEEIRFASRGCTKDPHAIMQKYDMLFVGKEFNIVYSLEVRHALQKNAGIEVSNAELNSLLPGICSELGIVLTPMTALNSTDKSIVACYQLTLW